MFLYVGGVLLLGVFVGFVSGMFGIGGGGIMIPVLLLLLPLIGVPETELMFMAMGTTFATMIITMSSSSFNHFINKNIDFKRVTLFLPILLLAVFLTSQIVTSLNQIYLKLGFASFLIYLGSNMIIKTKRLAEKNRGKELNKFNDVLYATGIGVIATLGSISGAGLIVTYLNSTGMNVKRAIGTASFCGIFLTISASLGFIISGFSYDNLPSYSIGFVHLPTVLIIALLAIPMTKVGVKIMLKLPDYKIKIYFGLFMISIGLYMIISTLLKIFS